MPPDNEPDEAEQRFRGIAREEGKAGALDALKEFFADEEGDGKPPKQDPPKGSGETFTDTLKRIFIGS